MTMGILNVYVYGSGSEVCISPDPRIGRAGWCDCGSPLPTCVQTKDLCAFGCIGFGTPGYNPYDCIPVPVERESWGAIKGLYR